MLSLFSSDGTPGKASSAFDLSFNYEPSSRDSGRSIERGPETNVEFTPTSTQSGFDSPRQPFDQEASIPPNRRRRRRPIQDRGHQAVPGGFDARRALEMLHKYFQPTTNSLLDEGIHGALLHLTEKLQLRCNKTSSGGLERIAGHNDDRESSGDSHPAPTFQDSLPSRADWVGRTSATEYYGTEYQTITSKLINRLRSEKESLSNLVDSQKRETDELRAQLEDLHSSINSFKARHLSQDLLHLFEYFDVRGKYFCDDRNCVFVCKDESELRQHRDTGVHCYISVAWDPWIHPPGNAPTPQALQTSIDSRPIPAPGDENSSTPDSSKSEYAGAVSSSQDPQLLLRLRKLERIVEDLDGQVDPISSGKSGEDDSAPLPQRQQMGLEERTAALASKVDALMSEITTSRSSSNFTITGNSEQTQQQAIIQQRRQKSEPPRTLHIPGDPIVDKMKFWEQIHNEISESIIIADGSDSDTPSATLDLQAPDRGLKNGHQPHNPDTQTTEAQDTPSNKKRRTTKDVAKFKCDKCPKQFTRSSTLREHARTHNNHRPFMCRTCGKCFVRLKDRNRHDALHTGEKKFACKGGRPMFYESWGCGRKFAREDALVAHFRNEVGWSCLRPLLTDAELRDCFLQFADGHDSESRFQCKGAISFVGNRFGIKSDPKDCGCEAVFSSKDDLEFHFQTTAGRKCIATLLVELATLDARRYRQNQERDEAMAVENPRSSAEDRRIIEIQDEDSLPQRPSQKPTSQVGSHRDADLLTTKMAQRQHLSSPTEVLNQERSEGQPAGYGNNQKQSMLGSTSSSKHRSGWHVRVVREDASVLLNHIRVMITDTSPTPRAHIGGWKAIFGEAVVRAKMVEESERDATFTAPVPSFSLTGSQTRAVPVNFYVSFLTAEVNFPLGEFIYYENYDLSGKWETDV